MYATLGNKYIMLKVLQKGCNLMKIKTILFFVCLVLLLFLFGCSHKYHEDQFLGKTSTEIMNEFGQFDCTLMPSGEDGLYRSCRCGYTIKEPQARFFWTSQEILFFVYFDENGIAVSCDEGYRPGG
jgi:hypothetical protein